MRKINKNFIKRKIYKVLPRKFKLKLLRSLLPEFELDLEDIVFRCAETYEDYLSAFNLVYNVFVKTGYVRRSTVPFRLSPHHCNEDSRVFIGIHQDKNIKKLIYSISIFPDSENGLPMDTVFQKELAPLRSEGRFIVEAGHLAADPTYKMNNMNIPMLGNKMLHHYVFDHLQADDLVITIHPKHRWIYEDLLFFEKIGEVNEYAYANNNPALAMRLDLRTVEKKYEKAYNNSRKKKNLYHFFFLEKSNSIILENQFSTVDKSMLTKPGVPIFETIKN